MLATSVKTAAVRRLACTGLLWIFLQACSGALQPVQAPVETTPLPSHAQQWLAIDEVRDGDWFHLLNIGSEAFDWRLRAIDSAVESIELQTFIWDLDDVGHQILAHLLAAAERGVAVRVLVDDSFLLDADEALLALDRQPGIELKIYNPYKRRSSHVALRNVLNAGEFFRLDHRMHNKVMVVDSQVAIIGGRNLATQYFGYHPTDNFRDMEVVTGGPVVLQLADAFDQYWNNHWSFPVADIMAQRAGHPQLVSIDPGIVSDPSRHREHPPQIRLDDWRELVSRAHPGRARLLVDAPPPERPEDDSSAPVQVGRQLLQLIDQASDEIWLVSAYLIPTPELESALARAVNRGVAVKILTNSISSNNHLAAHSAYRKHVERLVQMGADVHELRFNAKDRDAYIDAPVADKSLCLHAKLIILDEGQVFVGSANLDPRSLHINTEMGLLIDSPSLNSALRQSLQPDFSPRNAWHVQLDDSGSLQWVADDEVLGHQPTHDHMRRLEDWFLGLLPIEQEM